MPANGEEGSWEGKPKGFINASRKAIDDLFPGECFIAEA